jgi:hypothetical protein
MTDWASLDSPGCEAAVVVAAVTALAAVSQLFIVVVCLLTTKTENEGLPF